MSKVTAVWRK